MDALGVIVDDGLGVEQVSQLLCCHAQAGIGDGDFHVVLCIVGLDAHPSALWGELAGVVGQGVEHEEGEHAVGLHRQVGGLHLELDALHLEAATAACHDVEQLLQLEALYLQAQLASAQLYPVGQQVVVVAYLVGQLTGIFEPFVSRMADGVAYAVDEWCDGVHQRNLGSLLQMESL